MSDSPVTTAGGPPKGLDLNASVKKLRPEHTGECHVLSCTEAHVGDHGQRQAYKELSLTAVHIMLRE